MIENGEAYHARVFDGAAHQLVILDASSIIGDRDDTGLRARTERASFRPSSLSRSRPWGAVTQATSAARSLIQAIVLGLSATGRIWHATMW